MNRIVYIIRIMNMVSYICVVLLQDKLHTQNNGRKQFKCFCILNQNNCGLFVFENFRLYFIRLSNHIILVILCHIMCVLIIIYCFYK